MISLFGLVSESTRNLLKSSGVRVSNSFNASMGLDFEGVKNEQTEFTGIKVNRCAAIRVYQQHAVASFAQKSDSMHRN